MYAIRQKDSLRFFYGFDTKYDPPRPRVSFKSHLIKYYNHLEEAEKECRELGDNYEIVNLHYEPHGVRRAKEGSGGFNRFDNGSRK